MNKSTDKYGMPRKRKFSSKLVQNAYDQCLRSPPEEKGGIGNAYRKGVKHGDGTFSGKELPACPFPRGSASYGAWAAGVDNARIDLIGSLQKTNKQSGS